MYVYSYSYLKYLYWQWKHSNEWLPIIQNYFNIQIRTPYLYKKKNSDIFSSCQNYIWNIIKIYLKLRYISQYR